MQAAGDPNNMTPAVVWHWHGATQLGSGCDLLKKSSGGSRYRGEYLSDQWNRLVLPWID